MEEIPLGKLDVGQNSHIYQEVEVEVVEEVEEVEVVEAVEGSPASPRRRRPGGSAWTGGSARAGAEGAGLGPVRLGTHPTARTRRSCPSRNGAAPRPAHAAGPPPRGSHVRAKCVHSVSFVSGK